MEHELEEKDDGSGKACDVRGKIHHRYTFNLISALYSWPQDI